MKLLTAVLAALLLLFAVCAANGDSITEDPTTLYFSLMVSSAPTLDTTGVVSAVDRVLNVINNDNEILPGYRLQYANVLDTQCNKTRARELYTEAVLSSNRTVVAVVGCGCSSACEAVAMASNGTLPVISFSSTSVTLSDSSLFPGFFRTIPSDEPLAPALTTLMKYYGWRQLSIVTEREPQFMQLFPLFNDSLSSAGIAVDHVSSDSLTESVMKLKNGTSRVFYLNTNPRQAVLYLCKAYQEGRFYPEYIWITPGWYQEGWWKVDEDYLSSLNCSASNIQQQLDRSLSLLPHPNTESENITSTFNSTLYAIDAVMTLARALNQSGFNNTQSTQSLVNAIGSTRFSGASNDVRFDERGNRESQVVLLQQFRLTSSGDLSKVVVARIMDGNFTYINAESNTTVWPGSDTTGIPPVIDILNTLKVPVYAYVLFLVAVGVILSTICLAFNIIFRNKKVVKLTSPNLNYVIILGALLLIIGNVFVPSPSQNLPLLAVFCTISRIFLSVGYDICFVVALVKTIRVAYIFWNVSPVKKKVRDWQLLLLATGIIMIEIIYTIPLLAVIYVNGDTSIVINESSPPFMNEQGYAVVNRMIICGNSSIQYIIYLALSVSFKLIIHIIGLILAFLTRKVKIDPLNDSRYSAILIYFSCVFLVIAIVIFIFLEDNNLYAGIWTTFVLIEVCVFLGFNFIPKMVSLYKDPQGEKIFSGDSTGTVSKSQFTASVTVVDNVNETRFSTIAAEARE